MRVEINREKYANHKLCLHVVDEGGVAVTLTQHEKEKIERENRDKEVCLNCKKKKCEGYKGCFERERAKRDGKD